MKLYSPFEIHLCKTLNIGGELKFWEVHTLPGQGAEVPEELAQNLLKSESTKSRYFSKKEYEEKFGPTTEVEEIKEEPTITPPLVIETPAVVETLPVPEIQDEIIPPDGEPVVEEKKEETEPPIFSEEELNELNVDDLVSMAREIGITTANKGWKKETLITKILGVTSKPPIIE